MEFSAVLLSACVMIINLHSSVTIVGLIFMILGVVYFFMVFATLIFSQVFFDLQTVDGTITTTGYTLLGCLLVFVLFSWFWTTEVLKNVVHVTMAGIVGCWYYDRHDNVVSGCVKRACTTSFGSICFGALLVAIFNTLAALARILANNRDNIVLQIIGICMYIILKCFADIIQYFNKWAFTYVAVYGLTYVQSGKAVFGLIRHNGIDAIVNDSLIYSTLWLGALIGTVIVTVVSLLLVWASGTQYFVLALLINFLIGLGSLQVLLELVNSAMTALFVCIAEEPNIAAQKLPALWEFLHRRYAHRCPIFVQSAAAVF